MGYNIIRMWFKDMISEGNLFVKNIENAAIVVMEMPLFFKFESF